MSRVILTSVVIVALVRNKMANIALIFDSFPYEWVSKGRGNTILREYYVRRCNHGRKTNGEFAIYISFLSSAKPQWIVG